MWAKYLRNLGLASSTTDVMTERSERPIAPEIGKSRTNVKKYTSFSIINLQNSSLDVYLEVLCSTRIGIIL